MLITQLDTEFIRVETGKLVPFFYIINELMSNWFRYFKLFSILLIK